MKYSYFNLIILYPVLLILSYCKEKDKAPEPTASATISYAPIVSWTKAGQIPLIYAGDTIKYNITATASSDITELNVYKVDAATEVKTLLPGYPKTAFSDKKNITDQVYVPVGATADFKAFYLSIETKEGTPVTTKSTYKYTALSELTIQNGLKLNTKGDGTSYNCILNYQFSADQSKFSISYPEVLLLGTNSSDKINGIGTQISLSGGEIIEVINHSSFIRNNLIAFEDVDTPLQIINTYIVQRDIARYYYTDIQLNDIVYAKLNPIYNDTINTISTHAIIKVVEIVDNQPTFNSYLKFDAKIFNPYRF